MSSDTVLDLTPYCQLCFQKQRFHSIMSNQICSMNNVTRHALEKYMVTITFGKLTFKIAVKKQYVRLSKILYKIARYYAPGDGVFIDLKNNKFVSMSS